MFGRFEIAQLAAEIGIVIASVGLLLSRKVGFARTLWCIALVLGIISLSVAGFTKIRNMQRLHDAEERIHEAVQVYESKNRDEEDVVDDKKLQEDIRRDIKRLTAGS